MPDEAPPPHWGQWYKVVEDNSLRQGDIFRDLVAFYFAPDTPAPPEGIELGAKLDTPVEWVRGTWILLTASCDVERRSAHRALLAPVYPADKATLNLQQDKALNERLECMKRGLYETKFLLAAHPDLEPPFPLSFVEYRHCLTLPVDYLARCATGKRLRLQHPFRELFGTWAGSCVSRIGPEDVAQIPSFIPALYDAQRLRALAGDAAPEIRGNQVAAVRNDGLVRRWWKKLFG